MNNKHCIISASINEKMKNFIGLHKISPSKLLQDAIIQEMNIHDRYNSDRQKLEIAIKSYQEEIKIIYLYLETQNKFEEFRKWRGEYDIQQKKQ